MQLYEKLYHLLFNAITDALSAMEGQEFVKAQAILIQAQRRAEELYLEAEE